MNINPKTLTRNSINPSYPEEAKENTETSNVNLPTLTKSENTKAFKGSVSNPIEENLSTKKTNEVFTDTTKKLTQEPKTDDPNSTNVRGAVPGISGLRISINTQAPQRTAPPPEFHQVSIIQKSSYTQHGYTFKDNYNTKNNYAFKLAINGKTLLLQGRYDPRTFEITATGAFGRVFFGVDPDTGQKIAVKVVQKKPNLSWEDFYREGQILLAMQGKEHVVGASEIGIQGDFMFVVMDEIEGKELFDFINTLTPAEKISIFLDIAKGLKEIHDAGFIHRDIKPENVMVDANKKARIIDFGSARKTEDKPSSLAGTLYYMAPEILKIEEETLKRKEQTPAIDVYSFGLLMYTTIHRDYHVLTKANYSERQDNIDIDEEEYNLDDWTLDKKLAELTTKCLKLNPEERITAEELVNELKKINESQPKADDDTYEYKSITQL